MSTINAPLRDVIAAAKRLELHEIDVCPMGDPWPEITGSLFSKRLTAVSPNEFRTQYMGDFSPHVYAPYIPKSMLRSINGIDSVEQDNMEWDDPRATVPANFDLRGHRHSVVGDAQALGRSKRTNLEPPSKDRLSLGYNPDTGTKLFDSESRLYERIRDTARQINVRLLTAECPVFSTKKRRS